MIPIGNNLGGLSGVNGASSATPARASGVSGSDFSDVLKKQIDEVARLQQDATQAVDNVMTGKSDDVSGVMTAVEKSDLAFKTLLAIRTKLMEAYDEVKNMQV